MPKLLYQPENRIIHPMRGYPRASSLCDQRSLERLVSFPRARCHAPSHHLPGRRRRLRGLALAWAFLLTLAGCAPRQELSLVGEFSRAFSGPVLGPGETLGASRSAAFLAGRWEQSRETEERSLLGWGDFLFYADDPVPVTLLLEGKAHQATSITVRVNDEPPTSMRLTTQWSTLRLEVPASGVKVGRNAVRVQGAAFSVWRRFQATPALAASRGPGPGAQRVEASAQSGPPATLDIPYATRLVYPLEVPAGPAELLLDDVRPWNDPGAAPVAEGDWRLLVEVVSESPPAHERWELTGSGPHRLALPRAAQARAVNLALTPHLVDNPPPLAGQLGLTLVEPRLRHLAGAAPSPSPSSTPTPASPPPAPQRPNVVVYLIDTLRADHLGCYGYDKPTSPQLDALAREGIVFDDVTGESSWTKPSTATVLTGLPSPAHGVLDFADQLPGDKTTLAELFSQAGYQTAAFFTNPMASPLFAFDRGFGKVDYKGLDDSGPMTDRLLKWLDERPGEQPFFLYVHTLDPHLPYAPPADLAARWSSDKERFVNEDCHALGRLWLNGQAAQAEKMAGQMTALYDAEIASNDRALGRLIEKLKSLGEYDQTLILVISDHGEELFDRKSYGHLHSLYQELIRIPWVMKLPGAASAGTRVKANWRHLDMAPTILALAGLAVPEQMPGRAFSPAIAESASPPSLSYVHTGAGAVVTQQASHPYLLHAEGIRLGNYQLVRAEAQLVNRLEPVELYELKEDPQQKTNLAFARPVTTAHLSKLARLLRGQTVPSAPAPQADPTAVQDSLRGLQYLR